MASEVPLIELSAEEDEETLADAITGVEVVIFCAETVSPAHRLRNRKGAPPMLARVVEAARRARVGRLVHVSTADVFGPDHNARINEKSVVKPAHAYERLKLAGEEWLLGNAADLGPGILRPAAVFGWGAGWNHPRRMAGE